MSTKLWVLLLSVTLLVSACYENRPPSPQPQLPQPVLFCETWIGEYVTQDRAVVVRNRIQRDGYHAWIEYLGTLDTRTYAVRANLPCQ